MLVQETLTDLSPEEVIRHARDFFLTRFTPYGAFVEDESETHLTLSIEAGEVMIGAARTGTGRTLARGSTSRLQHELSQFLVTLGNSEEVRQTAIGSGTSGSG